MGAGPELPGAEVVNPLALVHRQDGAVVSRTLLNRKAGTLTLFAFDAGQSLSEHTAPFDALTLTLSGALVLTIGGVEALTASQTIVLMPANVPHAVRPRRHHECCALCCARPFIREAVKKWDAPRGVVCDL